jgi:hypothetical protein
MNSLTRYESMPVMTIENAAERHNELVRFVHDIMKEGVHYGTIPGTPKPTLYKPGGELLCMFFGLTPRYITEASNTPQITDEYPLWRYIQKCQLWRGETLLSEGHGSCNSYEKRYRFRKASRVCPICEAEAIIKGREEYGGGWLCWRKKGGCGAKFQDNDESITSQEEGQTLNPDMWDLDNTILKMANKRALIAAVLGMGASEFFTQDMEDIIEGEYTEIKDEKEVKKALFFAKLLTEHGLATGEAVEHLRLSGFTAYSPDQEVAMEAAIKARLETES